MSSSNLPANTPLPPSSAYEFSSTGLEHTGYDIGSSPPPHVSDYTNATYEDNGDFRYNSLNQQHSLLYPFNQDTSSPIRTRVAKMTADSSFANASRANRDSLTPADEELQEMVCDADIDTSTPATSQPGHSTAANTTATASTTAKGKGKAKAPAADKTQKAADAAAASKPKPKPAPRKRPSTKLADDERIRKASKRSIPSTPLLKSLPTTTATTSTNPATAATQALDPADLLLLRMRDAGHPWSAITAAYTTLTGRTPAGSTLPNRHGRLVRALRVFSAADDAMLLEAKAGVEAAFEAEKWGMVAEAVGRMGMGRVGATGVVSAGGSGSGGFAAGRGVAGKSAGMGGLGVGGAAGLKVSGGMCKRRFEEICEGFAAGGKGAEGVGEGEGEGEGEELNEGEDRVDGAAGGGGGGVVGEDESGLGDEIQDEEVEELCEISE